MLKKIHFMLTTVGEINDRGHGNFYLKTVFFKKLIRNEKDIMSNRF